MLEKNQFNEIKQIGVGKDEEKVKNRVKGIWLSLPKTQRSEILGLSGLTIHAVMRSYKNGKLSLRLALALAQSLKINPYYLSGASDERDDFSDEIINQFLKDNGHGDLVEGNQKPRRKYNRKPKVTPDSAVEVTTAVINSDDVSAINESAIESSAKPKTTRYDSLVSTLQEKVRLITESEDEKLNSMPFETAEQLLKGLYLRSEFNSESANLVCLVKLLLSM